MRTTASIIPFGETDDATIDEMVRQFGWDPRDNPEIEWSVLAMKPTLIHAWQSEPEIDGRTIMRKGAWVE